MSLLLLFKSSGLSVCNTTSPTGNVLVVTGLAETLLPGCSLSVGAGATSVGASWNIWVSQNRYGVVKQATLRLRRTDVTGAVLASQVVPDAGDSNGGHQYQWNGGFTDYAPTDGVYVLTVQETLGDASTEIWSDTRTFCLDAPSLFGNRVTQGVVEPAFEAGGLRVTQALIEQQYEAGGVRGTQLTVEQQYEAGGVRVSQLCVELFYLAPTGKRFRAQVMG